jgi:hypothetical protein
MEKEDGILTKLQKNALYEFYSKPFAKIAITKPERDKIWDKFKASRTVKEFNYLEIDLPSIYSEMKKALDHEKNIQPAVFSECVYAKALANHFQLSRYQNHLEGDLNDFKIPKIEGIKNIELNARYSYTNKESSKILIQAGGNNEVDCALYSKHEQEIYMIELKEPYARTSEPDLPKYNEDGYLITNEDFDDKYPQFYSMLQEQIEKKLNLFSHMGNNVKEFSKESIEKAVTENYSGKKHADLICTEDQNGYLVMLPADDVAKWAKLEGEIRPSGRNHYPVWTPIKLISSLQSLGARIENEIVIIPSEKLKSAKARGGNNVSRFKISALFFVRFKNIFIDGKNASFNIKDVRQLNPSITAKMNFKKLDIKHVSEHYLKRVK